MRQCVVPLIAAMLVTGVAATGEAWAGESGGWQEKTEIMWEAASAKFVRRSFRVWDDHPELNLEFFWQPDAESGKSAGAVSGSGELIWYPAGASPYDRTLRYSSYKGSLKGGKPHGTGTLSVRSGLAYAGEWKDGLMEGQGEIDYATGERYVGSFIAGEPDGSGKYFGANGMAAKPPRAKARQQADAALSLQRSVQPISMRAWQSGSPASADLPAKRPAPVPLPLRPNSQSLATSDPAAEKASKLAQASGEISLGIYVDRAANSDFLAGADPELELFVYDQTQDLGAVQIRLNAPQVMQRWKGGGTISVDQNTYLIMPEQFAPVFLVIDLINGSDRDEQIVGGYIDVAESWTDLQPYFEVARIQYYQAHKVFDPSFTLLNNGWGPVENATITYSFGGTGNSFAVDVGNFDATKVVTTMDGFTQSGVNVPALDDHYTCPSFDEVPNCLSALVESGLFGAIGGAMYAEYNHVYTNIEGVLDYGWTDSRGTPQQSQSPMFIKLPVLDIDVGSSAEFGAPGPVAREFPAFKLALDRESYRIAFPYREPIGAQQNKRFAMTLDADKSSSHQLRIVLEFADGSTVASPPIDLLIFKPRPVELY